MKKMIETLTGNYSSSASVVDGSLVLSLPDAISPVVWRLELGQAKASALEVREGEDHVFTLLLKTPRGDANDIARFDTRARAISALMAVSRAMERAHGQIYPAANDSEPYNPALLPVPSARRRAAAGARKKSGIMGVIAAILVIVFLVSVIINMGPREVSAPGMTAATADNAPKDSSGVPVSADDFLKDH